MKTLRVAVIGLGVGERHAAAFDAHPRSRVQVLCDLSAEKLAAAGRKFPGARRTRRFADALGPDVDAVSIASYDDHHAAQVVEALRRGKHVFVEKPLCRTVLEARRIHAAWAAHRGRVKLASNLVLRAAPLYQWLKKEIRRGALGEIYAVDGDYLYGRLHKITGGWRKDVPDYSVMAGGGVHMIDLALWLTGQKPFSAAAAGNRICARGTAFKPEDYAAATFSFPSGLVARITANFGCVHKHQHVLRVFGTRGTFLYDDAGARLYRKRDPGGPARRITLAPLPADKGALIPAFVDAVLKDKDISQDTRTFLDGICASVAADRAMRRRRPQTLETL